MKNNLLSISRSKNGMGMLIHTIFFIILSCTGTYAQITGTVTSITTGETLPGVNVIVKGTSIGTITDINGFYSIDAEPDNTLQFSFIGFLTEEKLVGNNTVLDIGLIENITELQEVVVVGYGTVKKNEMTGSVSVVNPENIEGMPVARTDQMLQGTVSGVQVTQTSGAPGGDIRVRIRGYNSINAGNEPLVVVDGFVGGSLASINPNDIERIDVLKDPTSLSIYGARASNGVILVTTKRGKQGKGLIEFSYSKSIQDISKKIEVLNANDWAKYVNETLANDGASSTRFPSRTYPYTPYADEVSDRNSLIDWNTDWHDVVYVQGETDEYQLSFSGGTEKTSYYISGNMFDQQGIVTGSTYKRLTGKINVDSQVKEWFKIGVTTNVNHREYDGEKGIFSGAGISNSVLTTPGFIVPIDTATGNYQINNLLGTPTDNPLAAAVGHIDELKLDNLYLNGYAEVKIIDGLTFKLSGGIDKTDRKHGKAWDTNTQYGSEKNGFASISSFTESKILSDQVLAYDKMVKENHHINVIVGHSIEKEERNTAYMADDDFSSDKYLFDYNFLGYGNGDAALTANTSYSDRARESFFGRLNYTFLERYLFTVSGRRDGSSVFSENEKWGDFGSVAFGWNIHEEEFMATTLNYLSQLKLRFGYGSIGSEGISSGLSLYKYVPYTAIEGGEKVTGIVPDVPGNKSLKWETTSGINVGLEIGILRNRVTLVADYYDKTTTDLLNYQLNPFSSGAPKTIANSGDMNNKGIDLTFHSVNVSATDFSWNTDITFSKNKNQIVELPDGVQEEAVSNPTADNVVNGSLYWKIVGEPIGTIKGHIYEGVYTNEEEAIADGKRLGDAKYKDINGNGTFDLNTDITVLGNTLPKFTFGFLNSFSYKGFSLDVFFQGSYGNKVYNLTRQRLESLGGTINQSVAVLNRSRMDENGEWIFTDLPRASSTNTIIRDSRYLEDASFIRLQNLSLAYTLPTTLVSKVKISSFKVFVSAQNLLLFTKYTGYDPETDFFKKGDSETTTSSNDLAIGLDYGAYPRSKSFTFGVKLGL